MAQVILTIGGSDSGGGAGIQADIKTFSALGWHGTSVLTAITAQNSLGVQDIFGLEPEAVLSQLVSVTDDFEVAFAKTGMLHSAKTVSIIAEHLQEEGISFVLDPVIEAEAGGLLLKPEAVKALKEDLIPLARVVTPNIFEAEAISSIKVTDLASAGAAARAIMELGPEAVIVKGGHLDCTDLVLEKSGINYLKGRRVSGGNHGVGCTYSAALSVFLSEGHSLIKAAEKAQHFAAESISRSINVGRGAAPVNQAGALREESERFKALCDVQKAMEMLLEEPELLRLIPEVGSNIGQAIPGADSPLDVVAVEGRLVKAGRRVHQSGCVRFGASGHVARIILAAMSFDPRIRAAMNLSIKALEPCRALSLDIAEFDRQNEPAHAKTMSWGTSQAIKEAGHVPDVIWDAGGLGKEPMLRLLGASATEVAQRAVKLAKLGHRDRQEDIN